MKWIAPKKTKFLDRVAMDIICAKLNQLSLEDLMTFKTKFDKLCKDRNITPSID